MSGVSDEGPFKRRLRYRGKHPQRFDEKYKELNPDPETVAKVRARGKTPAGQHVPILVEEVLGVLRLRPGQRVVDATLGYGGHAQRLLEAVMPGGGLLGLDQDPLELPRTEARLRARGHAEEAVRVRQTNFAGLVKALREVGWEAGVDGVLADLGLSSMQIDNPERGFSHKARGPLDMRMNPTRGLSAAQVLERCSVAELEAMLWENADEPFASKLAAALVSKAKQLSTTEALAVAVRQALPRYVQGEDQTLTVRRVFQALRIEVNDEFGTLEAFLRALPGVLKPGGRVAILTFHSGEDRRVKQAFQTGLRDGVYEETNARVVRPTSEEVRANSRASSAKLRWAVRGPD